MHSSSVFVLFLGLAAAVSGCGPSTGAKLDKAGDPTYVCLVINSKKVALFMPKADDYSRIVMSGSYQNNDTWTPASVVNGQDQCVESFTKGQDECKYTMVHVESLGKRSMAKAYKVYDRNGLAPKLVFPVLTAVISVKLGEVIGITWDDGCHFCADTGDMCVSNIFTLPKTSFNSTVKVSDTALKKLSLDGEGKNCKVGVDRCTGSNGGECDLKVYVVWTGTDAQGNYLKSASLRFSRFAQYSIKDMYASAKSNTLAIASEVKSTADSFRL
jgi:hypothetical protein